MPKNGLTGRMAIKKMRPAIYVVILIVMFAFLLLSKLNWVIVVVGIFFIVVTVIRYLFWRNEFDY